MSLRRNLIVRVDSAWTTAGKGAVIETLCLKILFGVCLALALPAVAQPPPLFQKMPVPDTAATIEVWSFLPGNYEAGEQAFTEAVASFNVKYPKVRVNITEMPYGTYFDQLRISLLAQSGPDVVTMYGASQAYSYKDGLLPLQNAIDPALLRTLRFVPENYSADGHLYALPTGTYGYALVANNDIFAQAGIDPDEGLASWDALLSTCRKLAKQGIEPISSGWRDGFLLETYIYMISSQLMDSKKLQDWVSYRIEMDDDLFVETLNYVVAMRDAGCFGGEAALGRNMFDDTINRYGAGKAAMVTVSTVGSANWASSGVPNSSAHILPMVPTSPNPPMLDSGAEAGWAITKWSKHPAAALAFVSHLAQPDTQAAFARLTNVPANIEGATIEINSDLQRQLMQIYSLPDNHTGFAVFPLPVLAVIERNAVPLMSGNMDVTKFLDAAQRAFRRFK